MANPKITLDTLIEKGSIDIRKRDKDGKLMPGRLRPYAEITGDDGKPIFQGNGLRGVLTALRINIEARRRQKRDGQK